MSDMYQLPIVFVADSMEHGILAFSWAIKPAEPIGPEFDFKLVPTAEPGTSKIDGPAIALYWTTPNAEPPNNILLLGDVTEWLVREQDGREMYLISVKFQPGIQFDNVVKAMAQMHQARQYGAAFHIMGPGLLQIHTLRQFMEPEHNKYKHLLPGEL